MKFLFCSFAFLLLLLSGGLIDDAFADLQVSGTTVSGTSDSTVVSITITDNDGMRIWNKEISVDGTFEITMPRLENGMYTLSLKHGNIGGEQEIKEFSYSGPAPIGNFELEIELPDSDAVDFDSFATSNHINNFERLVEFIENSEEVERRLEVIALEMDRGTNIPNQELETVTRFTPDGLETVEYGISWVTLRAYNDIARDASQLVELIEDGMGLDSAVDTLGIIPIPPEIEDVSEIDVPEIEELEQIECEAEICVEECNVMPNCTVTWVAPVVEPEPEELGLASFVDETKDPQYYIDRYNNEPEYKEWFDSNFSQYDSIYHAVGLSEPIPEWVRGVFVFWANGEISDDELKGAISFLVENKIIVLTDDT